MNQRIENEYTEKSRNLIDAIFAKNEIQKATHLVLYLPSKLSLISGCERCGSFNLK
jgi:hypothetical protein